MAENKTITIVLKGINASGNSTNKKQKANRKDETMREFDRLMFSTAKQASNIGFGRYASLTEDYLANNTKAQVSALINTADRIDDTTDRAFAIMNKNGYNYATGGIRGALKGITYSSLTIGFTASTMYLQNQSRLSAVYKQLNETNFQTGLDASRAGLINNGRGTEN